MTWQPIETAPLEWEPILVWAFSESEREDAEDDEREPERQALVAQHSDIQPGLWWLCGTMMQVFEPTHWQPLPEPPSGA